MFVREHKAPRQPGRREHGHISAALDHALFLGARLVARAMGCGPCKQKKPEAARRRLSMLGELTTVFAFSNMGPKANGDPNAGVGSGRQA